MALTAEQKKAYLEDASLCPYCSSSRIEGLSGVETSGEEATQEIGCRACGRRWTDVYTLTGVEESEPKPEANFDATAYALCRHCDHFVDTDGDQPFHLDDGDQEYDHPAKEGERHTGAEWKQLRPELFQGYPDGKVGPNSRFHSRRGKQD